MAGENGITGYLFLVQVGTEVSTLNRQQLLGSMPKILDGLTRGTEVRVRLIDQAQFDRLVQQILMEDMK